MASTARMTAEPPASPAHAYHATFSTQDSMRKKNAIPKTRPTTNDPRHDRPASATVSSAGPTAASGHIPAGGRLRPAQDAGQCDQQGPAQRQPTVPIRGPPRQAGHRGRLGGDHPSEGSRPPLVRPLRPAFHLPAAAVVPACGRRVPAFGRLMLLSPPSAVSRPSVVSDVSGCSAVSGPPCAPVPAAVLPLPRLHGRALREPLPARLAGAYSPFRCPSARIWMGRPAGSSGLANRVHQC